MVGFFGQGLSRKKTLEKEGKHRRIVLSVAVTKGIFISVVLQVNWINVAIDAIDTPLELAPEVLDILGMNTANNVLLATMVNSLMFVSAFAK